jgi:hypothetical protein
LQTGIFTGRGVDTPKGLRRRCYARAVLPKLLRSWRVLVLAWAVLLAPQVSMVHALSHSLPGNASHSGESDKRKQAPAKVCDSCLALAQLGAALPSSFDWLALDVVPPRHTHVAATAASPRVDSAYDARAPPADLT